MVSDRFRVQTLYHVVRVTIEYLAKAGRAERFQELMSERDGVRFLDYSKFIVMHPAYAQFVEQLASHDKRETEEAWGDYSFIKYRGTFYDSFINTEAGPSMKSRLLARIKSLVMHLLTPVETERHNPEVHLGIPKLFSLSKNPTAIRYEGVGISFPQWNRTRGKTQNYAILDLVAEKYRKKVSLGGKTPTEIKLSYNEIVNCLANPKKCLTPPRWEGVPTEKRKIDTIAKNIRRQAPFSDKEMLVIKNFDTFHLAFFVPA